MAFHVINPASFPEPWCYHGLYPTYLISWGKDVWNFSLTPPKVIDCNSRISIYLNKIYYSIPTSCLLPKTFPWRQSHRNHCVSESRWSSLSVRIIIIFRYVAAAFEGGSTAQPGLLLLRVCSNIHTTLQGKEHSNLQSCLRLANSALISCNFVLNVQVK